MKPERIMKSVIPIIMAGIVAIYGVVVAVLISQKTKGATSIMEDFINLGAGLVGDAGVRGTAQQPKLYVGMILILIFAEVLGLY